jgi:hypothetical protein
MAVTAFEDLPLADRDRAWDGDAAESRVRGWAKADDEPNEKYRGCFVWYDADKKENSPPTSCSWPTWSAGGSSRYHAGSWRPRR